MRKSFTWFLSLMVLLIAFATHGNAQEAQETVELYAEVASDCYNEADDYTVTISVRDFIQLTEFNLDLEFNDAIFAFDPTTGVSGVHTSLSSVTVTEAVSGVINLAWDDAAVTIGDNVKTDILILHFTLLGYPGNVAESFSSDMEWTTSDFWYTLPDTSKDPVNTVVSEDGSLAVNVSLTDIETEFTAESCAGGDVTVTVTAPEADMYLFNEDPNPALWAWTSSASYLAAAGETVTIRVKDENGCMSLVTSVVLPTTVDPVAFTVETHDPSCYGAKGSVVISATGGTAPYSYWIAPDLAGAPDVANAKEKMNFQFSQVPGDYWVNAQDANDCADFDNNWTAITITDNNVVVAGTVAVTDVACNAGSDGQLVVTVTEDGGVATDDYQISINGGASFDSLANVFTFNNLVAGDYDVVARNSNGCVVTIDDAVTVTEPTAITFDMAIVDVACGGLTDGEIAVTNIVGGTTDYVLEIEEDGNVTTEVGVTGAGFTFTGLMPTYYSLTITDANGCEVEYDNPNGTGNTIAVQSPDDIQFDVEITDPLCNNDAASVAITNVTGGTGTYQYSFDGGLTWVDTMTVDSWVSPYAAMTISVANADLSCDVSQSIDDTDVVNPGVLVATTTELLAPTCIDGNDGNIALEITGGTEPYYYSINGSSWKEAEEFTNIKVGVGTHTIMVKDDNDCAVADIVETVTLESNVIAAVSDGNIDCFNDKTGTISVDVTDWAEGVVANYPDVRDLTFYVENEAGVVAAFEPSNQGGTATLFNAGIYVVWAVDNYTCDSNKDSVWITENAELKIAEVIANGASCFGSFEGTVTVHATGGNDPVLEYAVVNNEGALGNIADDKWLPFDSYDNTVTPPLSTVSFQVDAGTYWIAVRDNGCDEVTYGPIDVEGYSELLVDEDDITTEDPMCYLDSMGMITVPMDAVSGGAGSYLFTLLVDDAGSWVEVEGKVDQVTGEFTNLPAGSYAVLVEDAEDCPSYTTVDPIVITDPAEVTFTTDIKHMSCWDSNDGRITVNAAGGTGDYWYAINNTNTWIAFEEGATSKTYIVTETGTFVVWVKDENDCVAKSDTVVIEAPEQLGADITVDNNVTCVGDTDGQITVVGTGGWATMTDFEFAVNDGAWTPATTFAGLPAGEHTLYVRDVFAYSGEYQLLDCIDSVDFTITVPDSISYDVVISNVKCKDGADGSLTVNVLGGGTPSLVDGYTVQLTGDAYDETFVTGLDYSIVFEDLAHSHYTVYITDSLGCTLAPTVGNDVAPYTTIESWEVAEPAEMLTLDPEWLNDVTCYDGEDGSFALVATGGTAPYKYYAGLSIEPSGHVLVPEPPAADSDEWLDTDTLMVGAGTWVTWVLDANGCMVGGEYDKGVAVNKWRVKVEQPDSLVWAFDSIGVAPDRVVDYDMPSCNGSWDGVLKLVGIAGGSGTYNAHVMGMSAAGDVVDTTYTDIEETAGQYLLAGVPASATYFDVTVTDDNGCTSVTDTVVVDQPDVLEVNLVPGADAFTCADAIEGLIEANVVGGTEITGETEKYWYQLLKNDVVLTPWQADGSAFIVEVGNTFIIQVRDANGCTAQDTIVIDPVAPVLISSVDNISCFGDEKASATVNATGEPGRMLQVKYRIYEETTTYTVHPELFETSVDLVKILEFDAENIDDKHYEFIVTDDMGCESTPDTLTFDYVQTELVYTAELSNITECSQDVTISVGGGTAPYVVMVNDSVLVDMTYTMERGTHVVKVMDSHMCYKEETIVVEGEYVVRDTTINTYIDETTAFVDVEAGVDTMLAVGTHQFVYTLACERTLNVTVVEIPRPYAIVDIQGDGDVSPVEGKIAEVTATVTAISAGEGFFVQDANAINSGLWVEYSDVTTLGLSIGDGVVVVGKVDEIAAVTSIVATEVTPVTAPLTVEPVAVTPTDLRNDGESYESVLVAVDGARVAHINTDGSWAIFYEATEAVLVNDWLYAYTPVVGNFYDVTGVVNGRLDSHNVEPRMESDIVDLSVTPAPIVETVEFSVYPNPFNDVINVVNHEKLTRVVISNIAGQRVMDVAYPNSEIRTNSLVSGIYVVSMFTENGIAKTEKIIKK